MQKFTYTICILYMHLYIIIFTYISSYKYVFVYSVCVYICIYLNFYTFVLGNSGRINKLNEMVKYSGKERNLEYKVRAGSKTFQYITFYITLISFSM